MDMVHEKVYYVNNFVFISVTFVYIKIDLIHVIMYYRIGG